MKKILVVWPIHREDWIKVFKDLQYNFDFHFLPGVSPESTEKNLAGFATVHYWRDFKNAQDVLSKIKPHKIIFMSIDSGLNITLNDVAKRAGVKTYILQHGIYTTYKDYRIREKLWRKADVAIKAAAIKSSSNFSTLSFIKNSLNSFQYVLLLKIAAYAKLSQKKGPYWTAKHLSFSQKKPDYYICFSPRNAEIHRELENPKNKQFLYIGSNELHSYLTKSDEKPSEKYYLHIDQALSENSFGEETVPKDQMINFYHKLNDWCKGQDAKLYIKLHPESYYSKWLPQEDNIVYLRKVDNLSNIIQGAEGCFGFYSTMIIPAVYWNKVILFEIYYSALQEHLENLNVAKRLSFYTFSPSNISFEFEKENTESFFLEYFYNKDLKPSERLSKILNE